MRYMSTEQYAYSFLDNVTINTLQNFLDISLHRRFKDSKHESILSYFLKNPNSTATNVYEAQLEVLKHLGYNTIRRYILDLKDTGLLEITKSEPMPNMKSKSINYYGLTLIGLLNIITNDNAGPSLDLIQSIVLNHKNNVFFTIFLYPFIKEETILALASGWNTEIFLDLHIYLRDICKGLDKSLRLLKTAPHTTSDGYVLQQIFFLIKDDAEPLPYVSELFLRYFLRKTFNWNWIDEAKFIPHIKEKTVEIRNPRNANDNCMITIREDEKMGILRRSGIKLFEFLISEADSMISFEIKTPRKRIDSVNFSFVYEARERLLILLTKLREQSKLLGTVDIFYKDERLKNTLESMDLKPLIKFDSLIDH